MVISDELQRIGIRACDCLTPFGDAKATHLALLEDRKALALQPVLGVAGGDPVPLALLPGRALDETPSPAWLDEVKRLLEPVNDARWGSPRHPVFITSSNFGVGSLHGFKVSGNPAFLQAGATWASVNLLRNTLGWGTNVVALSHACVSAHLGLLQATRALNAGIADSALVFSYDFLSPFVTGGFHALKILNNEFPAPYQQRESGSIGLGDGAAYAVLTRETSDFTIEAQCLHNELYHFTANQPDGAGFQALLAPLVRRFSGRRIWIRGHGTGTLEAGRLEATSLAASFPGAPLVGWKGSLGHTLGSCGLVELATAIAAIRHGRTPGTVGSSTPTFTPEVSLSSFDNRSFDGLLSLSNAFGGAHAALLLGHA